MAELARGPDRLLMDGAGGSTVMASATAVAAVVAAAMVAAVAVNGSRHDEGDERRNIRSMHGRGTPSPPPQF